MIRINQLHNLTIHLMFPGVGVVYFRSGETLGVSGDAKTKGIDSALLARADTGDAHAPRQLGDTYYFGNGVRRDYAQAALWYRRPGGTRIKIERLTIS